MPSNNDREGMAANGAALKIGREGTFVRERPELSQAMQGARSRWVQVQAWTGSNPLGGYEVGTDLKWIKFVACTTKMSGKAATRARLETHPQPGRYQPIVVRRHYEGLTSAVEPLPRTAGTQLLPGIQYLSKAEIGYPRSNDHALPHDSANLLALHTP
ncbi:hypothetical protein BU17DRAFT_60080 [Hysterangium stoloniferum]|nr:hypothetical protein BU17DRAFT_60080 [Hysterangium stoloniferum]